MTAPLLPLFLISAAAVGFETALTRYFAVATWSEYGYWVISIVMAGLALSGVAMALARDAAVRRAAWLLRWLPVLLIPAAALGYAATQRNPFNPLQLQNAATWLPQLGNIGLYYVGLLPFFFLAGVYISLSFVLNAGRIGRAYAADLTGAGAGAALVLVLMFVLHPFALVPALLLPLAGAAMLAARGRIAVLAATLVLLAGGEALLLADSAAGYNQFKAIYAPLHVPNSRSVLRVYSPRGLYELLDDFTERVDTDVSNNAGDMGLPGPPRTYGLYRDGTRLAAVPMPPPAAGNTGAPYAPAALNALPFVLRRGADVLVVGASGGFRVAEALALGAARVTALEPDPVLRRALRSGIGPSPGFASDRRVRIMPDGPIAAVRGGVRYDVIDISADFLDAAEGNSVAFSADGIAADLRALAPRGIVSIPVSIRDFPAYAVRMLSTVRRALILAGADDPPAHVLVYRSAWNVRILVSPTPWDAADIAMARKFCDDRSFDVAYFPGMDPVAARASIYNDLPPVSFDSGEVATGGGPHDAIADEAGAVLRGEPTESQAAFNLAPITLDRPFYYAVLRLGHLGIVLRRLEILPQAEIGSLVNLAVLAQAVVLAAAVLLVPGLARRRVGVRAGSFLRMAAYFSSLGLGFLFVEIFLIEKASVYLNDRTSAFAIVLTGMLVFSGLGSLLADRAGRAALAGAVAVIVAWCALVGAWLEPALLATLSLPWGVRALLVVALLAPASLAMGLPFPMGLNRAAAQGSGALPWAWALNGAFSVVATPLANLTALEAGYDRVLLCAGLLYVLALMATPMLRKRPVWQDISAT